MNDKESDDEITPFPLYNHPAAVAAAGDAAGPPGQSVKRLNVLLIEDNRGDARLIREHLAEVEGLSFELECADRLATGLVRLARGGIDVVLLDLSLPDSRGLDSFQRLHAQFPRLPVVVLSGLDDETLAVKAVQHGAEDYLVKGHVDSNVLVRSLRYAIERTRRQQAERTLRSTQEKIGVAREIQQGLFPSAAPALPGFDIAGASYPAEATGGDYFDYIPLLDGSVGVVISDVAGHGFGPALLMASTRTCLRALAQTHTDAGKILTLSNRVLTGDIGDDRFVTLFLGRLDPRTRAFAYASAGHPTGYVLDRTWKMKRLLQSTGIPLGVLDDSPFTSSDPLLLEPGDLVLLLTDGVVEARAPDGTSFGTERALDIAHLFRHDPARYLVDNLYYAVRAFSQNLPQLDDITVLVIKVDEGA